MPSTDADPNRDRVEQPDLGPPPSGRISIRAVVNGTATEVRPSPNEALLSTLAVALHQTGNTGRPVDEWTVTDDLGRALDPARIVGDLDLQDFGTIFIQVEVGAGG